MTRRVTPYGIIPRPKFVVTNSMCITAEEHMEKGITESQLSSILGIAPQTLVDKKKEYPELKLAIDRGRAKAIAKVESALFINATNPAYGKDGPTGPPAGSVDAQKFFLKTRAGYKENDAPPMQVQVNVLLPPAAEPLLDAFLTPETNGADEPADS